MALPFSKKKSGTVKESLDIWDDPKAGCDLHGGEFDERTGKCIERNIRDQNFPEEVTTRKFDEVHKPSRRVAEPE